MALYSLTSKGVPTTCGRERSKLRKIGIVMANACPEIELFYARTQGASSPRSYPRDFQIP